MLPVLCYIAHLLDMVWPKYSRWNGTKNIKVIKDNGENEEQLYLPGARFNIDLGLKASNYISE